jgi:hypothetical protein
VPQLIPTRSSNPANPMPTNVTLLTALLASGLAIALSREHRIRRAFQTLAARLLDKLRQHHGQHHGQHTASTTNPKRQPQSPRRHA